MFVKISEEEENLKDRIRELETRNKELEKLAAVAKEERRTYNYGMFFFFWIYWNFLVGDQSKNKLK